jgi:hypothetical protein
MCWEIFRKFKIKNVIVAKFIKLGNFANWWSFFPALVLDWRKFTVFLPDIFHIFLNFTNYLQKK